LKFIPSWHLIPLQSSSSGSPVGEEKAHPTPGQNQSLQNSFGDHSIPTQKTKHPFSYSIPMSIHQSLASHFRSPHNDRNPGIHSIPHPKTMTKSMDHVRHVMQKGVTQQHRLASKGPVSLRQAPLPEFR
jgi:hypothetical protein